MSIGIHFLGGAGTLVSRFLPLDLPTWAGSPVIRYIDTSESEKKFVRKGAVFTLFSDSDTMKGSGGLRASKSNMIKEQLPGYIVDNPHCDINIVVVSSTGASGAVIAHHLVDNMLAAGKKVILLVSQSPTTMVRAANSLKTLMGFRAIASKHKNSIVGYVYDATSGFEQSDRYLVQDLTVLLYFLSGNVEGVDESDINVLLSPEKLPDMEYKPDLYSLNILFENKYESEFIPMSILTLSPVGGTDDIGSNAPVSYSGIIDTSIYETIYSSNGGEPVLSLAIYNSHVPTWLTSLSRKIDMYKQKLDVQRTVKTELPKGIDLTSQDDLFL